MASENAKQVARDVLEKVRKSQKIVLGKIIRKRGYSESVSKRPSRVTKTKSYQVVIKPILSQLEKLRQRILDALEKKKLPKERFKDLTDSLAKINHDIQLIGGKDTEKIGGQVNVYLPKK